MHNFCLKKRKSIDTDSKSKASVVTGWKDIDNGQLNDEFNSADYVSFIFKYYREREVNVLMGGGVSNMSNLLLFIQRVNSPFRII